MKVLKNIYINLFFTLVIGIFQFVLNKYFAKSMGIETLGLMRLFTQLVAYLNLADLGIATASAYALYKPLIEKNHQKISVIMNTLDNFYKKISILIIGVGIISFSILNLLVKENHYGVLLYVYWFIYVINIAVGYYFAKYNVLFTADQKYSYIRMIQGSSRILVYILQLVILIYLKSFLLFLIIMTLENIISGILYRKKYKLEYKYIEKTNEKDKTILKDIKNLFWHKIGGVVVFNTDYIVLSKFTSLKVIAMYSTYLIIYNMLLTVVGVITPAITPALGNFIATNTKKIIYKKWKELYSIYVFIGTVVIVCGYLLFTPFVNLWMGKEYILPKVTLVLLLVNLFIQMTRQVTEIFKNNSGFYDDIYVPALESGINLVASIILVQKLGLNGVIIGTICSNVIVIYFVKPILVFYRCFDKNILNYLIDLGKNLTLSFLSIGIIIYTVKWLNLDGNYNTWLSLVLKMISFGVISLGLTLIVFMTNSDFRKNLLLIRKK